MFFPVTDSCSPAVSIVSSCTTRKRVFLVFFGNMVAVISLTTGLLSKWQPFQPGFITNEWKMGNKSTINMGHHNYCIHRDYSVEPLQHCDIYWEGTCWKPRSEQTLVMAFRKSWGSSSTVLLFQQCPPPTIIVWHCWFPSCVVLLIIQDSPTRCLKRWLIIPK